LRFDAAPTVVSHIAEAIQYRSLIVMVGWGKLDLTTNANYFIPEE
jgi:hypothetical protein